MKELINRRAILAVLSGALVLPLERTLAATLSGPAPSTQAVSIENFAASGKSAGVTQVPKIVKSEAEWQQQLSPAAFTVARKEGTERAYTGEYASSHGDGLYHCVCCDTVLFDSRTKFESGTGWPSFFKPISALNVGKSVDNSIMGMARDAVSCRRCDAHLGHVFDDGPRPTGLRYCMNSVSLHFVPRA
jgi:peptide-methionine (R)-S-oxide reductase